MTPDVGLTVNQSFPERILTLVKEVPRFTIGRPNQIDLRIVSTELTLADSPNSKTCRLRFIIPFSGIRCPFDEFLGLKEPGRP